jgi:hypothetical protein
LLTAGTLKVLAAELPTLARGLNANALADEAAIARNTTFFIANMVVKDSLYGSVGKLGSLHYVLLTVNIVKLA